jgi:hypothetical protein
MLKHRVINDLDRYQELFDDADDQKALGEATARYLAHPRSPELIHQFIPNAKLIASLRQPAERAFSAFVRRRRDGMEPCADFATAIQEEKQGLRKDWTYGGYLEKGLYYAALKRYLLYFEREQMHISLMEDLQDDPKALLKSIFHFLGTDEDFVPSDISHRHNPSGIIRNPALRALWTGSSQLRALVRPLSKESTRHAVFEWLARDVEKPQFPPQVRAELTEYFREDILQLQDLIERDLSHWLKPAKG